MKKALLLAAIVAAFATTSANAEPKFGIVGYTGTQAAGGVYVSDDSYTAALTLGTESDDQTVKKALTYLGLQANYKAAVDSTTGLTAGIGYTTVSGEKGGATSNKYKSASALDLNVGVEKWVSSSVAFIGNLTVYRSSTVEDQTSKVATTSLLPGASVGIAVTFN